MFRFLIKSVALIGVVTMGQSAVAQSRTHVEVDSEMLERPGSRMIMVEQLVNGTVAAPGSVSPTPQPQVPVQVGSLDGPVETALLFPIQFAYNSSDLDTGSKRVLDQVAAAILSDQFLSQSRFLVEGHTDAIGSWVYNRDLSFRRARSVATYLTQRGLQPSQLVAVGYSWNRLIPGLNPLDARHRRVEIGRLQ